LADLLEVTDLHTQFFTRDGVVRAVDGVTFRVAAGETLGIVGESGCGKSVTALSLMRLIPQPPGKIVSGSIMFDGQDILKMDDDDVRAIRGHAIAMIFQDPMTSLNPCFTVEYQLTETLRIHEGGSRKALRARAIELLRAVEIPDAEHRLDTYPHQLSGGMSQRVMVAMAIACNPRLLIADEPTTALDVTIQAQMLALLLKLQRERGMGLMLITHDLGVVAELADDILVMYAGRAVEYAAASSIFGTPQHPYTWGLLASMPRLDRERTERLLPIKGTPPSLINVPPGCPFHPRCAYAELNGGASETVVPELHDVGGGHFTACHLSAEDRVRIWETEIKPKL